MVRKNDEKLMTKDEIKEYISLKNGNIIVKKKITPNILYKIAKSLNKEFYFIMLDNDNIIPVSKFNAEKIFKNGYQFKLNQNPTEEDIFSFFQYYKKSYNIFF